MIKLENWSVTFAGGDPYTPPEAQIKILQGNAFGHPRSKDGEFIHTSPVVKVEGRVATTFSGSVYELGKIDPKYRAWLKKNFPQWDYRRPLAMGKNEAQGGTNNE